MVHINPDCEIKIYTNHLQIDKLLKFFELTNR